MMRTARRIPLALCAALVGSIVSAAAPPAAAQPASTRDRTVAATPATPVSALPSITRASLSGIRFSGLCGMSGKLTKGRYWKSGYQGVWLVSTFTAVGRYLPGKKAGAVAALQCTTSGTLSSTSTYLLFLDSAGRRTGTARVGDYTGGLGAVRLLWCGSELECW